MDKQKFSFLVQLPIFLPPQNGVLPDSHIFVTIRVKVDHCID